MLLVAVASFASAQNSFVLDTLSQELDRNFAALKQKAEPPVYFLSYEVTDQDFRSVSGTLGTIENVSNTKNRILDV